jgi:curved DNA-binding protein CbpA
MTQLPRVQTHYDNLKVTRDAPPEVIRAAYRSLTLKYHPDRNGDNDDTARIMRILNAAYDVLSDPARREEHDRWIADNEADDPPLQTPPVARGMRRVRSPDIGSLFRHLANSWHWYGLALLTLAFALALGYWLQAQRNAPVLDSKMLDSYSTPAGQ